MKVIFLEGRDLTAEKQLILEFWKESQDTVFLLNDPHRTQPLYQYIENLNLKMKPLLRVRIARELTDLNAEYTAGGQTRRVERFSEILRQLDPRQESYITILGDRDLKLETVDGQKKRKQVRAVLADVVQQLAYLELPLSKIQVRTEQEALDMERVRFFENRLVTLRSLAEEAGKILGKKGRVQAERTEFAQVGAYLQTIQKALESAMDVEMRIMVGASKKSGKSVVVNCMTEQELAPTSLLTATPNNCIYRRSKSGAFTLDYKAEHSEYTLEELPLLRGRIQGLFKQAELDSKNRYAIPDMELGYVKEQGGFTSYTLYDTPGPDLAGAVGHREAKDRALKVADMVIFIIDFTKHLTEEEVNYLREVRDAFERSGRYFSLVILVNKLDERLNSEGKTEKNITRILDYIREKLISMDPSFKDVILLGSSALTYYRCINAPRLPDCEKLAEEDGLRHLKACIRALQDSEEEEEETDGAEEGTEGDHPLTCLNFLQNIANSIETFQGQEVHSLEELKAFSGMPDVLTYIDYIARNKARQEKINNLISTIDENMVAIENLFGFQHLAEELARNKGELQRVRGLLEEMQRKIREIYDEDFPEVRRWVEAGNHEESTWVSETGKKTPFNLDDTRRFALDKMQEHLSREGVIEYVVSDQIPYYLEQNIRLAFQNSRNHKKIKGEDRPVVTEEIIKDRISVSVKSGMDAIPGKVETLADQAMKELKMEALRIQRFLAKLLNDRIERLRNTVEEYREKINGGVIHFDISTPSFAFQFQSWEQQVGGLSLSSPNQIKKVINALLESYISKDTLSLNNKGGLLHLRDWWILGWRDAGDINRMCYDPDYVIKTIYHGNLREHIAAGLRNSKLEEVLAGERAPLCQSVAELFTEIQREMENNFTSANSYIENAKKVLDTTEDMEGHLKELEERRRVLEEIYVCVEGLLKVWTDEVKTLPAPNIAPNLLGGEEE